MKIKVLLSVIMSIAIFAGSNAGLADAKTSMIPATFADVAEKVSPAVVNISSVRIVKSPFNSQDYNFFNDQFTRDFFEHFYGPNWNNQREEKSVSLGSGVIVDEQGYILTNNHVVEGASEIIVKMKNGNEVKAELVGTDPKTDVAVIKLKQNQKWPAAEMGDSDLVRVGDWAIAVGSPFGLEQSVTSGIISAKSRTIGQGPYDDFLQTDASINRGNSGGPLVNLDGEIIGINTAIVSQSGGSIGIGFAIPINMAKKIYHDIVKTGSVKRGWLGVYIQQLTPQLVAHFNLPEDIKGVLINAVFKGGPAEAAGVKPGDVVIAFDGKKVQSDKDLLKLVAQAKEGAKIPMMVIRNNTKKRLYVKMGDRAKAEGQESAPSSPQEETVKKAGLLGIEIEDITATSLQGLGTENKQGVLISKVYAGSPAESAGIMPGDIIRELNRKPVTSMKNFNVMTKGLKPGDDMLLLIERRDYAIYVAMKIPAQ